MSRKLRSTGDATTVYYVGYDEDYQHEECDGGPMPMSEEAYAKNAYQKDGQPVSYADYLDYYGNPDRHVVLFVRREDKCPHCGNWTKGDAVYGIDCMDDDKEAGYGDGTYTLDKLPGYLREVAEDLDADESIGGAK